MHARLDRHAPLLGRGVGCAVLLLATLPLYRFLGPDTGLAGSATVQAADARAALALHGALLVMIPGVIAARARIAGNPVATLHRQLLRPSSVVFAIGLAVTAAAAAAVFSVGALNAEPNLIDAVAQLQHARYLAEGRLAGPVTDVGHFWHVQQSLVTSAGWVSQYPPLHVLLLGLGLAIGAAWIIGPLLLGTAVFFTALSAERLFPSDPVVARTGAILTAASPFLIAHAGAFMSHTSAAAFGAAAMYCLLRARTAPVWALACGAAVGLLCITRPLTGVAVGVVAFAVIVTRSGDRLRGSALLAAGAAPALALLAAWNAHFFGSPTTFGYTAALGPAGALGFGPDPWGNHYGPLEAIAYTSAELMSLNTALLETPFPLVALTGAYVLAMSRLSGGEYVLLAWVAVPLLAHLLYWHHGIFMGPRMLNDTAPAWVLLATAAAFGTVRRLPAAAGALSAWSPRRFVAGTLGAALLAGPMLFGPLRLAAYAQPSSEHAAVEAAFEESSGPLLIFVHSSWADRVAMRLAADGMRLDSVETALRQNSTCAVQLYADARDTGGTLPPLDFVPRATDLPERFRIGPGSTMRAVRGEAWPPECAVQANADRFGVIDVSRLLWQGSLAGLRASPVMYARDFGPELNERLIVRFADRSPRLLVPAVAGDPPILLPYAQAVADVWGPAMLQASRVDGHPPTAVASESSPYNQSDL
jgi:hypothetical protein